MASDEIRDGDSVHTAVSDLRSDVTAIQDMLTDILARTSAPSASIPSAPIVSSKFPVCLLFVGRAGAPRRFLSCHCFGVGARSRSEASLGCYEPLGFRGFRGPIAPFLRSVATDCWSGRGQRSRTPPMRWHASLLFFSFFLFARAASVLVAALIRAALQLAFTCLCFRCAGAM